jgi:hypothetical protein
MIKLQNVEHQGEVQARPKNGLRTPYFSLLLELLEKVCCVEIPTTKARHYILTSFVSLGNLDPKLGVHGCRLVLLLLGNKRLSIAHSKSDLR